MKNAKIILFSSLIVAMILPFSVINYAEAESENKMTERKALKQLKEDKKELKSQLKETIDSSKKKEIKNEIKRINAFIKLLKAQMNSENVTVSAKQELESTYDDKETGKVSTEPQFYASTTTASYSTTVIADSCYDSNRHWGKSKGAILTSSFGSTIHAFFDYPANFGHKGHPCVWGEHEKSVINLYSYGKAKAGWCNISVQENYGAQMNLFCSGIKSGQMVVIFTDAEYDKNIKFGQGFVVVLT